MAIRRLEEALQKARRETLAPPPLLDLAEWAECYARLPVGQTRCPDGGCRSNTRRSGSDAITDPAVRQVSIMKSARVGYTRCLDHAVGYYIHQDPSPILMVLPRIEDCRGFFAERKFYHC